MALPLIPLITAGISATSAANNKNPDRSILSRILDPIGLFSKGTSEQESLNMQEAMQKRMNEQASELNYQQGEKAAINAQKRNEEWYNKYGSPQAMVEQYKEAGLNPALLYGGGGGSGGGTGSSQAAPTGGIQAGNAAAMKANSLNMRLIEQQERMNAIQGAVGMSTAIKQMAEAKSTGVDTENVLYELGLKKETEADRKSKIKSEADSAWAKAEMDAIEAAVKHWDVFKNDTEDPEGNKVSQGSWAARRDLTDAILERDNKIGEETAEEMARNILKLKQGELEIQDFERQMIKWQKSIGASSEVAKIILNAIKMIWLKK